MLTKSLEDYLESIKILEEKNGIVRVKDIGKFLNVKNPSVVSALNILSKKGYIQHEKYGYIKLTETGEKEAEKIYERHKTIAKFLENVLGLSHEIARKDACKIEHIISPETYKKIKEFMKRI